MKNTYYLINAPKVVDEVFEDEIIVINFDNGDYFSLRASAIDIWKGIKLLHSAGTIAKQISQKYDITEEEAYSTVVSLIDNFLNENLINTHEKSEKENDIPSEITVEKLSFEAPIFEKFTDMNDLLLLDPVHDVDEKGWPHINPDEQTNG
jgi:hypothetical protein